MRWGTVRYKRTFKVMIVDGNAGTRQELANYYAAFVRAKYLQRYDDDQICRVNNIPKAQEKVQGGFNPHIIIFAMGFPEAKIDELRHWLASRRTEVPTFLLFDLLARVA